MMGLATRLGLAKVMVFVEPLDGGDDLAALCDELASARAAMVLLQDPDATPAQLAQAFPVVLQNSGFDAIVGLVSDHELTDVRPDTQLSTTPVPRAHQWALLGRQAGDEDQLRAALADQESDYVVVGADLVGLAAQLQPATQVHTKPWFVGGAHHDRQVSALIAQGARRFAFRAADFADDTGSQIEQLWELITQAWRSPEMERIIFGAFRHDAGQQRRPDQEPPVWPKEQNRVEPTTLVDPPTWRV